MEFNTSRPWWYRHGINISKDTWSLCWATAHSLYYYLRVNAEKNSPYTKGIEAKSAESLEPGDLIFLQNEKDQNQDYSHNLPLQDQHLKFVLAYAKEQYLSGVLNLRLLLF